MRKIEYISPTALGVWESNKTEYYLLYLADERPPRIPQNRPMAIGSAFDAYVKSYLYEKLFGTVDPKFELSTLIEAQVEAQNRDWARQHGAYVFDCYKQSGALNDLLLEMQRANGEPRFEFEVRGAVHGYREGISREMESVVLLGKPDASYVSATGVHVILDFKVNGYCSGHAPSPMAGYIRLRRRGGTNYGQHKSAQIMMVHGMMINVSSYLEDLNISWATQLAIYGWLCGESVGGDFVVAIDQLCCDATKTQLPEIKVAEHRLRISGNYQQRVFARLLEMWEIVQSDWIFRDMSREQSLQRCAILDEQAAALKGDGGEMDAWFATATRGV
jgi:hypothetical protein